MKVRKKMNIDKGQYIEKCLKDSLRNIIANSVDEEIDKKVKEFQNQLVDRRDQYIAEIMKGIRILHSQNIEDKSMNYKIIFENVVQIEKWGKKMSKQELNDKEIMLAWYYMKLTSYLKTIEQCKDLNQVKDIFLEIIEILDKMIELDEKVEDK